MIVSTPDYFYLHMNFQTMVSTTLKGLAEILIWFIVESHWISLNLIGKDSDAGRDWRQEEKGTIEDEMAGWHH